MPHSSGGGSSGGGFHSSSSSSSPSTRYSNRPFPGAMCYVYYDSAFRPRTIYTNVDPTKQKRNRVGLYIGLAAFLLVPGAIIPIAGFHNPQKIATDYSTTMYVRDDLNVISESEETTLRATFQEFLDLSGVSPSVVTIQTSTWKNGHYASLTDYAYDKYLAMFNDESHWLIVYSADDTAKTNWAFEGMQGNNTDPALMAYTTDGFNKTLYEELGSNATVGAALNHAFRAILPTMMQSRFYVEPGLWIFMGLWEAGVVAAIVITIVQGKRAKLVQSAVKVEGQPKMAKCEHCGNDYYEGTVTKCPKCGADITHPHYAHFEGDVY